MMMRFEESVQDARDREYWLGRFSEGVERSSFPYDHPVALETHGNNGRYAFTLPSDLTEKALRISNGSDVRLFILLLSGVSWLLHRYTQNREITVGVPIWRQEAQGEYVNTVLAVKNRVQGSMAFKDLLLAVAGSLREANEHMNYPIHSLAEELGLGSDPRICPLFDCAALLDNLHDPTYLGSTRPAIVFEFSRAENSIEARIAYRTTAFATETIERIARQLELFLAQALDHVERPLALAELLHPAEKERLIYGFNETAEAFDTNTTLHRLFFEQVEKTPERVALVSDQGFMTYGALASSAHRIAALLRTKGIQPGSVVGVVSGPSTEMVAGILGVLEAGAAYLPIDPEWPEERIFRTLEECEVGILLASNEALTSHAYTRLRGLRQAERFVQMTPPRPPIVDLDILPIADRTLVDYDKYFERAGIQMVKNNISLLASRGCPYKCTYCHDIWPRRHKYRSAENLFEEVKHYYDLGVRRFSLIDDIFNLNVENSSRFYELVLKAKMDEIQFFFPNGLRGDILKPDYIDLMMEAGTTQMALALETASPRLQRLIKKNLKIDKLHKNLEYIAANYPHVVLDLFTMHGFPTETKDEARMTLDFIKSIKWLHFPYLSVLRIYPNSGMEELALQNDISEDDIDRNESFADHEVFPSTLPFEKEFTVAYQSEFLDDYFLNKERLRHVLPHQIKVMTESELVTKYSSYLPIEIQNAQELFDYLGMDIEELTTVPGEMPAFVEQPEPVVMTRPVTNKPVEQPRQDALRVLLLDLSVSTSDDQHQLDELVDAPLGLIFLQTYLEEQLGERIHGMIAQPKINFDSMNELRALYDDFAPDVIGLRTLTFHKEFFHKTIATLRRFGFEGPVIVGGPYPSCGYNTLLQDRNIDVAVIGEGEITFLEIIQAILDHDGQLPDNKMLGEIRGIAFLAGREEAESHGDRQVIVLEELAAERLPRRLQEAAPQAALPAVSQSSVAEDLAYVLFTSGSTGHPKGVMVEHRSALNTLAWYCGTSGLREESHTMLAYETTSDPSVEDIFAPLVSGATLCLGDKYVLLERDAFRRFADRHRLRLLNCGPGLVQALLDPGPKLASLDVVLSGGDVLEESLKNRILEQGYVLYNDYGPTEATIDCLSDRCGAHRVSLGRAISNMRCYVLGDSLNVQPTGAVGTLFVAGIGLARGYYGKPALTAQRFLPDPFGEGERMYDTGDLGRWRGEGRLEFLGRSDDQVKIRGYRVEIGEILYQLLRLPQIKDAVLVPTQEASERELCAYVVLAAALEAPQIRAALRKCLPDYMVPKHMVFLGEIPRTAIGKVDRRALPDPTVSAPVTRPQFGLQNDFEGIILKIWQKVLGLEEIGPHQNFFELGGHSLNVVEVKGALSSRLGKEIPIVALFQHATLRALGQYIANMEGASKPAAALSATEETAEDSRMDTLANTLEIFGATSGQG